MKHVFVCVSAHTKRFGTWRIRENLVINFHSRKSVDIGFKKIPEKHYKHIIYRYEDKWLKKELKEWDEGMWVLLIGFINPFDCWNYSKNKN